jgi:hypothetical protein
VRQNHNTVLLPPVLPGTYEFTYDDVDLVREAALACGREATTQFEAGDHEGSRVLRARVSRLYRIADAIQELVL